jgi:hypothetical protein
MTATLVTRGPASKRTRRVAGAVLLGITAVEAFPFVIAFPGIVRAFSRPQPVWAVIAGLAIAAGYIGFSVRSPGVRFHLLDRSWVRLAAIALSIVAGVVEELYFRRVLMDWLQGIGVAVIAQILFSGIAFGVVHAIWGIRAGWRVALSVSIVTGVLGTVLAVLYAIDGRLVVPCIIAHIVIDLVIEPGLMLNAVEASFERRNSWAPTAVSGS